MQVGVGPYHGFDFDSLIIVGRFPDNVDYADKMRGSTGRWELWSD